VFWWEFNKDRFLNLKAKIQGAANVTDIGGAAAGLGGGAAVANTLAPTQQQIEREIVPALFALIASEDDRDIATGVMVALAKIGIRADDAAKVYEEHLTAASQEVHETAALAYGIMQSEGAIPTLEALMRDTKEGQALTKDSEVDVRTRVFSAYGLGLIGRASVDPNVKQSLADSLYDVLITDSSAAKDLRVASVISIGILNLPEPTAMVAKLSELLDADKMDKLVLAHIPNAMAKLLKNTLADDPARTRAVEQFLKIADGRPKRDNFIVQSAIQGLGMLAMPEEDIKKGNNQKIYDTLTKLSKKANDQQAKRYTAISLAYLAIAEPQLRDDVIDFLVTRMTKSSSQYEPWCGLALGVMAFELNASGQTYNSTIVHDATLEKFLDTKDPDRKGAYAIALGLMKNEAAKPDLYKSMEKIKESEFRGYAAVALGLLDAKEYITYIEEVVDDSKRDPDLLKQASIGLGLMKDRNAVDKLLAYLAPKDGRSPRLNVLSSVATALGFIGDKSSVSPLVTTLENDRLTPLGRAFAAVALGMVADQNIFPWNEPIGANLNYRASVSTLVDQQNGTGLLDIL